MKSRWVPSVLVAFALSGLACDRQPESPASVDSADGVPIRYEVHGSGDPALVFVHGWSCDRTYWDAQIPYFSDRYRVVTIDLAGHGESGLEREVWSMRAFGQDVTAVVEELGLDHVVLVGHSMGGPVVVEAARLLGDRVRLVVGADTFKDVSGRYTREFIANWLQPFRVDFDAAMSDFVTSFFLQTSDSALIEQTVDDMSAAPPNVALGAAEELMNWGSIEQAAAFRELSVPVRLINSDYSPTNVDAGREYTSSFDAVLMSGVGHFVMMEDPATFNRLLSEIVEGVANE